jgi:hypothetical protein
MPRDWKSFEALRLRPTVMAKCVEISCSAARGANEGYRGQRDGKNEGTGARRELSPSAIYCYAKSLGIYVLAVCSDAQQVCPSLRRTSCGHGLAPTTAMWKARSAARPAFEVGLITLACRRETPTPARRS